MSAAQGQIFGPFFNGGKLVSSPKLYACQPGTTISKPVWTDSAKTVTAPFPIQGDAEGLITGYFFDGLYKLIFALPSSTGPTNGVLYVMDNMGIDLTSVTPEWDLLTQLGFSTEKSASFNTGALNEALTAGSPLYIPSGLYELNAIAPQSGAAIHLFGAGRATKLRFTTSEACFDLAPSTPNQRDTVYIHDLAFMNIGTPAAFIRNSNHLNVNLERLYFSDCAATYCIENKSGYGMHIGECTFSDVAGGAIRLKDNGASPNYSYAVSIENCDITRMSGHGIEVEAANTLFIRRAVIEGCGGKGVVIGTGSRVSGQVTFDSCYFESNTGADVDLLTDGGGTYWGRAVFLSCWFNSSAVVALGTKSKAVFIAIQGNGGSPLTISGSANAEAQFIGCEMSNFVKSGTFQWSNLDLGVMEMTEVLDPAAGAVNTGRLYVRDNGSGKTQLCVRFNTGSIQVLATEP